MNRLLVFAVMMLGSTAVAQAGEVADVCKPELAGKRVIGAIGDQIFALSAERRQLYSIERKYCSLWAQSDFPASSRLLDDKTVEVTKMGRGYLITSPERSTALYHHQKAMRLIEVPVPLGTRAIDGKLIGPSGPVQPKEPEVHPFP